jgi:hypothetical protein
LVRTAGTITLLLGLAATCYGAIAFFAFNGLPPNDQTNGRLPSLYILLAGMAVMFLGLTLRGLRAGTRRE